MPISIQPGGDSWAGKGVVLAAIETALADGAEDAEIRAAFGLGEWRVVTPEHRARYGAIKAPLVYSELVSRMRAGLAAGRLTIHKFVKMQQKRQGGELFPVTDWGPCVKAQMLNVDVSISAGPDDYAGGVPSGVKEGAKVEWKNQVGGVKLFYAAEYAPISLDPENDLFVVKGDLTLVVSYGGLLEEKIKTCSGLVVQGEVATAADGIRRDLTISNGSPPMAGPVPASYQPAMPQPGPYEAYEIARPGFDVGPAFSVVDLEWVAGRAAESVMFSEDVHALNCDGYPLAAAAFVNCFPRKKWIERREMPKYGGGTETKYKKVMWINRSDWLRLYGQDLAEGRLPVGVVSPRELVGDGAIDFRVYAQFDKGLIAEMNPE